MVPVCLFHVFVPCVCCPLPRVFTFYHRLAKAVNCGERQSLIKFPPAVILLPISVLSVVDPVIPIFVRHQKGTLTMSMRGHVFAMNPQRGMVAIETEGGFTIIELLSDDDIAIGDEMAWSDDTGLGSETYRNITKGTRMDVYVQNHWVPKNQLRHQLLMD
jgi:hypothetical protein